MAKETTYSLRAAAPAATGWLVSNSDVERQAQLQLVALIANESEPNAALRELAEEYRRAVAEGIVSSGR